MLSKEPASERLWTPNTASAQQLEIVQQRIARVRQDTPDAVIGYAPGAYDYFHVGHQRLLERASQACTFLIAGVATQEYLRTHKNIEPAWSYEKRLEAVARFACVAAAVPDGSIDKTQMHEQLGFDVVIKGDDWKNTPAGDRLELAMAARGVDVVFLEYTQGVSSTELRARDTVEVA